LSSLGHALDGHASCPVWALLPITSGKITVAKFI
jgi:hypothetical protein